VFFLDLSRSFTLETFVSETIRNMPGNPPGSNGHLQPANAQNLRENSPIPFSDAL